MCCPLLCEGGRTSGATPVPAAGVATTAGDRRGHASGVQHQGAGLQRLSAHAFLIWSGRAPRASHLGAHRHAHGTEWQQPDAVQQLGNPPIYASCLFTWKALQFTAHLVPSVLRLPSACMQDEAAGTCAGVHEVSDSSSRSDALMESSTFAASGAMFKSFGRAQSSHLQHAIVLPVGSSASAALFDMHFRAPSRVDCVVQLLKQKHSELIVSMSGGGPFERRVASAADRCDCQYRPPSCDMQ